MALYERLRKGYWGDTIMVYGFSSLHPFVQFIFYIELLILSMVLFHPFYLLTALIAMILLNLFHNQGQKMKNLIGLYLFIVVFTIILNPLFTNKGSTLWFEWLGYEVTVESVVYGLTTALSLLTIMTLFLSYQYVLSVNKLLFLFGNVLPKVTLVIMMTVRFVPLLKRRILQISTIQKTRGKYVHKGSVKDRAKNGMKILQILLLWSLEEAMQTGESMKARGYGVGNRSSYYHYKMVGRDWFVLCFMIILSLVCFIGAYFGYGQLTIYPTIEPLHFQVQEWIVYGGFCLFLFIPLGMELREAVYWNNYRSSI